MNVLDDCCLKDSFYSYMNIKSQSDDIEYPCQVEKDLKISQD